MDQVFVLATTFPDYSSIIHNCTQMFGVSPSRDLDKKNIPLNSPASFAMMLEVLNNNSSAVGDLENANISLDIVNIVFAVQFDDFDVCSHFCNLLSGIQTRYNTKVIFNLSLRQIRDLINSNDISCLSLLNSMYSIMCRMGYKSLFGVKKGQSNGLFTLR